MFKRSRISPFKPLVGLSPFAVKFSKTNLKLNDWQSALLVGSKTTATNGNSKPNRRILIGLVLLFFVVILIFTIQLVNLQLINGVRYAGLADGNRLRQQVTYAKRGRILDRNGVVLAENMASFQLVAIPYLLDKNESNRQADYEILATLLTSSANELRQLAEAKGLDYSQPILIKDSIDLEIALKIEQKLPKLAGFLLDLIPVRRYTTEFGLANLLGYVGRVSEDDLKTNKDLLPTDFIGRDGVEQYYDQQLRGQNGIVQTEIDSLGRPVRVLSEQATSNGQDLILSIDYELQKVLSAALVKYMGLAKAKRAAAVILHPQTGEILASVSWPSYDNNQFSGGINTEAYSNLVNNKDQPLYNKVVGGAYPSGSIIKPIHLAAALQEGVVNENTTIVDTGRLVVRSVYDPSVAYVFNGWNPNGLGPMNARRAVAMSSDIYFYTVGGGFENFKGLGVERLTKYYKLFGLGSKTGIDLPGETAGRVPTPEWKKQVSSEEWTVGDTYNISIGQGDLLVSPLQMAVATSAIANSGKLLEPHINKAQPVKIIRHEFVKDYFLKVSREGMRQVIGGTTCTCTFASVPVLVAGKSGTAETDTKAKQKPHAWYTAFAPYDNPSVTAAVLLEEGEGGSQFAAPVIARAFEWYFRHRQP